MQGASMLASIDRSQASSMLLEFPASPFAGMTSIRVVVLFRTLLSTETIQKNPALRRARRVRRV
jgi:hypothetical protein